jgi:hypothetical protein
MLKWVEGWKRPISYFLIACLLNLAIGCYYYTYKVETEPTIDKLSQLSQSPNYVIIHQGGEAWYMAKIRIFQDSKTMAGTLYELPPDHRMYTQTKPKPGSSNRYVKKRSNRGTASPDVINEVHLYTHDLELDRDQQVVIPLTAIEKIEIYDPDTGATTASFVFGIIGGGIAVLTVIVIVILLTKSSCPFVYVNDGESYVFAGEVYGGAVFKPIERDDYLTLPKINSARVEMVIANKLKERQFINKTGLIQVAHPKGSAVLADRYGEVHRIFTPIEMIRAEVSGRDVTAMLRRHDSINFVFDDATREDYFNDVVITFPKPAATSEGHLVLHARNSLWGDYVFGEFTRLFGVRYMPWVEKQNNSDGKEHKDWALDQGMAMKVFLEQDGQWTYVDHAELVGPLAYRDLVVPIDLSKHTGDEVKIRLSAGFMMWDLDFAGLDFTEDSGFETTYILPSTATTGDGHDARPALATTDSVYLSQMNVGDELLLEFDISRSPGFDYTYIFHSRGYYNHVREYEGLPDIPTLLTFREKGRFSKFSKEKLDEMIELMKVAEMSSMVVKDPEMN